MPTKDRILILIEELNEVKRQLRDLQTRQRNIDWLALRENAAAPTTVAGIAFLYIDAGSVKAKFGDGSTAVFVGGAENFTDLDDTPSSYTGHGSKVIRVNSGETALEFVAPTFLAASDTPSSYTGQIFKLVRVNSVETALEFLSPPLGDLVGTQAAQILYQKQITDTSTFVDEDNATRAMRLELGGVSAGNTRVLNVPDANGNIPIISSASYTPVVTGSGSNPTVTYTTQTGSWARVRFPGGAEFYLYTFLVAINTISGGSGNVQVSLPATANVVTPASCQLRNVDVSGTNTAIAVNFLAQTSGSFGVVATSYDNADRVVLPVSALVSGSQIQAAGILFMG